MDKAIVRQRIEQLREMLQREHLAAYIIPSTDPHCGEYVPERWEGRKWISGFDGSAGTVVITLHHAALWTDSRYFIAAESQLRDTGITLMKERMPDTPSISKWLGMKLADEDSAEVGADGMVCSADEVEALTRELRSEGGITLRTNLDVLALIWKDRPAVPEDKVEIQPLKYAGEDTKSKLARIRTAMAQKHACGLLVSMLDEIAWVLNMRGTDVHCNPVFVSYLFIEREKATLFINKEKLTPEVSSYLSSQGVSVSAYDDIVKVLKAYDEYSIMMDPSTVNATIFKAPRCPEVIRCASPIAAMKAVKNDAEIEGFRQCMLRDGVAMAKFLYWLKPAVKAGGQTEMSLDRKLTSLRAEQPLYRDISFDSIFGYEEHGAIVHYEATEATDAEVKPKGLLLMDTGGQYQDGTTDITRTVALGPVTEEQRHVYTLVLKGHINLAMAKFPRGAAGTQIDALARMPMWREGLNYMHGTGHGVGSYLNVHEGPHQIRMEHRGAPLLEGMTVTNEPGLYLEGKFGVRTENTMLVTKYMETEFGSFLQLEPLTLAPIDLEPADLSMLTEEEKQWLNSYHKRVYESLAPHLTDDERQWLAEVTREV